ncbi:hypothetical protein D0T84_09725 [Dysgonomonas sp. 521]|nr:hypothetical protein [Dysgonomonas sp. 521]
MSDKTNGTSFFVKYKLILGALLVGLGTASCGDGEDEPEIMCYDPASLEVPQEGSQKTDWNQDTGSVQTDKTFPVDGE